MTVFIEKVCINFQPSLLNISVLARKIEVCLHVKGLKFHTIEILHGGHVACQEQYNIIPMG